MLPTEITLPPDKRRLLVSWPDGIVQMLSARLLRSMSKSAASERARLTEDEQEFAADLTIDSVETVGTYAVNIQFSDGYNRGIYPWAMIREACEEGSEADSRSSEQIPQKGN